ncbi:hypothetical protein [Clostridium sp. LP20]
MKNNKVRPGILIIGILLISSLLLIFRIFTQDKNVLNVSISNSSLEKYNSISVYEKGGDKEYGIVSDLFPEGKSKAKVKLDSTLSESSIYMKYRNATGEEMEVCILGYIENGVGGTVNVDFQANEEVVITN